MRYRARGSGVTERLFDPYGVVRREGYWYAVGHDHLRGQVRLFRLDRVLEAEPLGETFGLPPEYDGPEAVLRVLADMPGDRWTVEVLLEAAPEEARGQLPALGVTLEGAPGGSVLRCSTSDLDWMARVLAGLDCPFVVRRPAELKAALEKRAAEILALARR